MRNFYRTIAITLVVFLDLGLLALCLREQISPAAALGSIIAIGICTALAKHLADLAAEEHYRRAAYRYRYAYATVRR